jgi:ubiquinone/menaquinone biosynthesis C-methylase UbiE
MADMTKNWDDHVVHAEDLAGAAGFVALRDRILELASPAPDDRCLDVGAGTGLLTFALVDRVERVFAIDISSAMCEHLRAKASSAEVDNLEIIATSAVSLPLADDSVDLVVSNYCFHHLQDADKERALAEVLRVLRPGGRFVFADMMFAMTLSDRRDRRVIASKVRAMLRKGPAGVLRLGRNALRLAGGTWEKPARPEWWGDALRRAGFEAVRVTGLDHEGGIALAYKA